MMMRQLASVSENYGHTDATWNLWPDPMPGSSLVPSSSSLPNSASAAGLRLRGTSGSVNGSMSELLAMLDRVREVLPHIPDELIMEVHLCFAQLEIILKTFTCTDIFSKKMSL